MAVTAATLRIERDAAHMEVAELRAKLASWDRLYSGAVGVVIDETESKGADHTALAWRTWTEYANGRTTIHTDPPEATVTLCSLVLLRALTAENNDWKQRALHAEALLDDIARGTA